MVRFISFFNSNFRRQTSLPTKKH